MLANGDAIARVRRLLAAAREVANDAAWVPRLVESTGLSRQGVELGLARYLEHDATDEEVAALVRGVTPASSVHVILSANVFTAPLRALAVACAASSQVSVHPSRRDPVLARALVENASDLGLALTDAQDVPAIESGEIHVYGRDETVSAVKGAAHADVRVRAHGAGMGVALVDANVAIEAAAYAVADDVVAFDQRGCCSPRVVFALGPARDFCWALARRLWAMEEMVPRGKLDESERRESVRYRETMAFAGEVFLGSAHAVGFARQDATCLVPPVGRHVHVVPVASVEDARAWLRPIERFVVLVGCGDERLGRELALASHVRLSPLGRMQRLPFDGPVDLR